MGKSIKQKAAQTSKPDLVALEQECEQLRERVDTLMRRNDSPLAAWFMGPKAEQADVWSDSINYIFQDYVHWRRNYFPQDNFVISRERRRDHEAWFDSLTEKLDITLNKLKAHFPSYSPRYVAHMVSEQTLPGVLGYFAGMLYNPNNVTDESAPITVKLELEVGKMIAEMLGYDKDQAWAHLCSGGTVANVEALWVARAAKFLPFTLRDYVRQEVLRFPITLPNGEQVLLTDVDNKTLIHLAPDEAVSMTRQLAHYLVTVAKRDKNQVFKDLNTCLQSSDYNVNIKGLAHVLGKIGLRPKLFVSATAHYSIKKAANLLGYGEDAVSLIPVNDQFQADVEALATQIKNLADDEYIAAVVGIVGTTETGTVDPIHKMVALRNRLAIEKNQSFWLHADAAWGGYISSVFRGYGVDISADEPLKKRFDAYHTAMGINASVQLDNFADGYLSGETAIGWHDPDVYGAFLQLHHADSITIDPHKLGFIPYPAGVIAFKNGLVTELVTQKAQYISDIQRGLSEIGTQVDIDAVGPYILEGSKPGAAAAACWLAHQCIPLTYSGHGKIMRATLLNTQKLKAYLNHHRDWFKVIHKAVSDKASDDSAFTFIPICEPDTNILCFVARPMTFVKGSLQEADCSLEKLNALNKAIYAELSVPVSKQVQQTSYNQPFFVSRTRFTPEQYAMASLVPLFTRLGIDAEEYREGELFVLRSTVMNPLYHIAETDRNKDYLYEFLMFLHKVTLSHIKQVF